MREVEGSSPRPEQHRDSGSENKGRAGLSLPGSLMLVTFDI